jgi:hypothetical protein
VADPFDVIVSMTHARRVGNSYRARCPGHDDPNPSLNISRGDRVPVVLYDHGGCSTERILAALGLPADFLSRENAEESVAEQHSREDRDTVVRRVISRVDYAIRDATGSVMAIHRRTDYSDGSKSLPWLHPDGTLSSVDHPIAPAALPLYRSETLNGPVTYVFITEGEKAADALARLGVVALGTVTGAKHTPSDESLALLAGRDVVLWPDNDDAGRRHMELIASALDGVAASVTTLDVPGLPDKGDAADWKGSYDDLLGLVIDAVARPQPAKSAQRVEIPQSADASTPLARPSATAGIRGDDGVDLLAMTLEPLQWIVPELLPEGTTVLVAPPKIGKSLLVYQFAVEVSLGGSLLEQRVASGSTLYYALEDGRRRGQERLLRVLDQRTLPRGRLEIRWQAPLVGKGLEDEISRWLDEHPDARLVAIDTLVKVRPPHNGKQNVYDLDSQEIGAIQNIVRERPGIALVVVHHTRKSVADDFVSSVSGSHGLTGAVDTILSIKRGRLEQFGTISVVGRDIEDTQIAVQFTPAGWVKTLPIMASSRGPLIEVLRIIQEHGPIFPRAIVTHFPSHAQPERTAIQNVVTRLVNNGAIVKTSVGYAAVERPGLIQFGDETDADD